MAGGDMRVIRQDPVGNSFGSPAIDCNSTRSGNMTVPMEVDGKTAWFTPEGAMAYAQLQGENAFLGNKYSMKLESDPSLLSRFFFGDPRSETCPSSGIRMLSQAPSPTILTASRLRS